MNVLGLSAFYHDSAAALVVDGEIASASQEERFSRLKHDNRFPENAINFALQYSGISVDDLDLVVFYEHPEKKFNRILSSTVQNFPSGFKHLLRTCERWVRNKSGIVSEIQEYFYRMSPEVDWQSKIYFSDHHLSHAASAFYPSPFPEASVLTIDGVGEWTTTAIYRGDGNELTAVYEIQYPQSLGLLYSAFTQYLGFKVNSGEYKVMGLAPYGEPKYANLIKDYLIEIKMDGSFKLNMKYFDFHVHDGMVNDQFLKLFGQPIRKPESPLLKFHTDVASSIQRVTNEIMLKLAHFAKKIVGSKNLCIAGGVGLNCVANGYILREKVFDNVYIQPSAGDSGGALGAALLGAKQCGELKRSHLKEYGSDGMKGTYLGPKFSHGEIKETLINLGARLQYYNDEDAFLDKIAKYIAENKVVGWFQGRMEFGPRALGARSILGNPMSSEMQSLMNLKIKYREGFRPFAPSVLLEDCQDYFELDVESPYMLLVATTRDKIRLAVEENSGLSINERLKQTRTTIPAVTHVDYSARIQTVDGKYNNKYFRLLKKFKELTGCSVLVNTSFNVRGEPIVCTPEDAYKCFMGTEMDVLAIDNFILLKEEQPEILRKDYKGTYGLD